MPTRNFLRFLCKSSLLRVRQYSAVKMSRSISERLRLLQTSKTLSLELWCNFITRFFGEMTILFVFLSTTTTNTIFFPIGHNSCWSISSSHCFTGSVYSLSHCMISIMSMFQTVWAGGGAVIAIISRKTPTCLYFGRYFFLSGISTFFFIVPFCFLSLFLSFRWFHFFLLFLINFLFFCCSCCFCCLDIYLFLFLFIILYWFLVWFSLFFFFFVNSLSSFYFPFLFVV